MILAGFGLAWLAALGLSRLSRAVSPRALRIILPLLALAAFLDREEMARRLSPIENAAILTQRPPLLETLPDASVDAPPPRLFFNDAYEPVPIYDKRDIGAASRVGRETLLPAYASLFGVGYQFEVDYDLSLSAEAFEWTRLLTRAVPERPSLALRFVRGAGVSAIVKTEPGADGRYRPHLARIGNALPPYRFATHVVASADARAVFARLLEDGFSRRHGVRRLRAAGRSRLSRGGPDRLRWPTGLRGSSSTSRSTARPRASSCSIASGKPPKKRRSTAVRFRSRRWRSGSRAFPCRRVAMLCDCGPTRAG